MLGVMDIYALRRKVLIEGQSQRRVAREMGSRGTQCAATWRRQRPSGSGGGTPARCWTGLGRG